MSKTKKTGYVRAYWANIPAVSFAGTKVIHTSRASALMAALVHAMEMGVNNKFKIKDEYDIVDCLDAVLITWEFEEEDEALQGRSTG